MAINTAVLLTTTGSTFAAATFGTHEAIRSYNHPAHEGVQVLVESGYKDVSGGRRSFFNTACGKGAIVRLYDATTPDGIHKRDIPICYTTRFRAKPPRGM